MTDGQSGAIPVCPSRWLTADWQTKTRGPWMKKKLHCLQQLLIALLALPIASTIDLDDLYLPLHCHRLPYEPSQEETGSYHFVICFVLSQPLPLRNSFISKEGAHTGFPRTTNTEYIMSASSSSKAPQSFPYDHLFKLLMIGDSAVGKVSSCFHDNLLVYSSAFLLLLTWHMI